MCTYLKRTLLAMLLIKISSLPISSYAQCGAGTTQVAINFDWQYFDTIPVGNFSYMLGKSSMQMKWTGTTNTFLGTGGRARQGGRLVGFSGTSDPADVSVSGRNTCL